MRRMARYGTTLPALFVALACGPSPPAGGDSGPVEDAGVPDASVGSDADIAEGTCTPAQRARALLDGPNLGAAGLSGAGPWSGTIAGVDESGVDLALADGTSVRFAWTGTSLAGLSAGMHATLRHDPYWTVLETDAVALHAMRVFRFVGSGIVGVPHVIAGAPLLTLVEACWFPEHGTACGEPTTGPVVVYDLDVGGTRLAADESTSGIGYEVHFGGSAQFPGYDTEECIVEAAFAAWIAVRVERPDFESCEEVEAAYERVLEQSAACDDDGDCTVVAGQCSAGLGGCYEAANRDVSDELEELGRAYAGLGCPSAVCDCAEPPTTVCAAGRCALVP